METIDNILFILSNRLRRRIIELLSEEPRYLFQLSKELGDVASQPAILKHLRELEEHGIVESYEVSSVGSRKPRKYYRLRNSFLISICVGDHAFRLIGTELSGRKPRISDDTLRLVREGERLVGQLERLPFGDAVRLVADAMEDIDRALVELEGATTFLLWLRQTILKALRRQDKFIYI